MESVPTIIEARFSQRNALIRKIRLDTIVIGGEIPTTEQTKLWVVSSRFIVVADFLCPIQLVHSYVVGVLELVRDGIIVRELFDSCICLLDDGRNLDFKQLIAETRLRAISVAPII